MRCLWIRGIRRLVLVALVLQAMTSHAQPPLDGMLLGLTETALQENFSSLHRMRKPAIAPNGLRDRKSVV